MIHAQIIRFTEVTQKITVFQEIDITLVRSRTSDQN